MIDHMRSIHSQRLLHRTGLAEGDYEKADYKMVVVVRAMKEAVKMMTMQEISELEIQKLDKVSLCQ